MSQNYFTPIVDGVQPDGRTNQASIWNDVFEDLDQAITDVDTDITTVDNAVTTLNTEVVAARAGLPSLDARIDAAEADITAAEAEVVAARGAYPTINDRVGAEEVVRAAADDDLQDQLDSLNLSTAPLVTRANGGEISGATAIDVDSTTGFATGDTVGFVTANGYQERTVTVASGTQFTVAAIDGALADNAILSLIPPALQTAATAGNYDSGTVTPTISDVARWAQQNVFHPEAYGAVAGFGVGAGVRTANRTAFQAMANAIADTLSIDTGTVFGAGTILIPAGQTFEIDDTIRVFDNTLVTGGGTIYNKNTSGAPAFEIESAFDRAGVQPITFDNIAIRGDATCGHGIACTRIRLNVSGVVGTFAPGNTITTSPNSYTAVVVEYNAAGGYMIVKDASNNVAGQSSLTSGANSATIGSGRDFYLSNANFINVRIHGSPASYFGGNGWHLDTIASNGTGYVSWFGCWAYNLNGWGAYIESAGSGEDNSFFGCTFSQCYGGVRHAGAASPRFYGTRFVNCRQNSTSTQAGRAGIWVTGARTVTVHGCRFEEPTAATSDFNPGVAGYAALYGAVSGPTANNMHLESCSFSGQKDILYAASGTVHIYHCDTFSAEANRVTLNGNNGRIVDCTGLVVTNNGSNNQIIEAGNPLYAAETVFENTVPNNSTLVVDLATVITKYGIWLIKVGTDDTSGAASTQNRAIYGLLIFLKGLTSSVLAAPVEVAATGGSMTASRTGTQITYGTSATITVRPKIYIVAEQLFESV